MRCCSPVFFISEKTMKVMDAKYAVCLNARRSVLGDWGLPPQQANAHLYGNGPCLPRFAK